MKVMLDLDALIADGTLTPALADLLRQRGQARTGGGVIVNLLLILGALGVAAGVLAFEPSATMGLLLAGSALAAGLVILLRAGPHWQLLAQGLAIMGALGLSGWIGLQFAQSETDVWPPLAITAIFAAAALAFRNGFLAALATLSLGAVVGSGTGYWHASYFLVVRESAITIALFGLLAAATYAARERLNETWKGLCTISARTSVFMVNFGFWIGSLWGDHIGEHWQAGQEWEAAQDWRESALYLPEWAFTLGWAGALIAVIVRARQGSFLSVSSIVFLAIHAYTQFFEILGAEPLTLIVGGVAAVALAIFLSREAMRRTQDTANV